MQSVIYIFLTKLDEMKKMKWKKKLISGLKLSKHIAFASKRKQMRN